MDEDKSSHLFSSLDMLHTGELLGGFITSDSILVEYMVKVFIDLLRLQHV